MAIVNIGDEQMHWDLHRWSARVLLQRCRPAAGNCCVNHGESKRHGKIHSVFFPRFEFDQFFGRADFKQWAGIPGGFCKQHWKKILGFSIPAFPDICVGQGQRTRFALGNFVASLWCLCLLQRLSLTVRVHVSSGSLPCCSQYTLCGWIPPMSRHWRSFVPLNAALMLKNYFRARVLWGQASDSVEHEGQGRVRCVRATPRVSIDMERKWNVIRFLRRPILPSNRSISSQLSILLNQITPKIKMWGDRSHEPTHPCVPMKT